MPFSNVGLQDLAMQAMSSSSSVSIQGTVHLVDDQMNEECIALVVTYTHHHSNPLQVNAKPCAWQLCLLLIHGLQCSLGRLPALQF